MTDLEIGRLASGVLHAISTDLNEGVYKELGGSLSVGWVSTPRWLKAEAHSPGDLSKPPEHTIFVWEELALQLYRHCETYHDFAANHLPHEPFSTVFAEFDPKPRLPEGLRRDASVQNMFIGGLTWIFFHELGHLMQEHGQIRDGLFGEGRGTSVVDAQSQSSDALSPCEAIISHVTELAADVEAVNWCLAELIRHFFPSSAHRSDDASRTSFRNTLYLMVCGISCALYLFAGHNPRDAEPTANGTHPTPMRRLEVCLPNIFERLDDGGRGYAWHGLDRRQLVYLCTGAAYSVGFFWVGPLGIPAHRDR